MADANDPAIVKESESNIIIIAKEVKNDPNYHHIPLDAKEDQEWFATLAFLYWDKKYTKEELIEQVIKRFPDYKDSFEYLTRRIKKQVFSNKIP